MKKITLLLSLISLFIGAKAQTFSDDFEADTLGKLGPQSAVWTTWSNDDGGAEDVDVVDTDNHTPAGTKSIYFSSTSSNGGPTDCILPFSGTPLSTGKFSFTSWFKIPSGKTAYFNFQGDTTLGDVFTLECSMEGGYLYISNDGNDVVSVEHPVDTWFKLTIDVNLNTNKWNLLIDDVVKGTWKNAVDLIVAVDFYPANKNASYWVDDVSFNITPYVLPAVNGAANAIAVPAALVGQSRKLNFTARNLGQATITSFDLSVTQNNGTPVTQSFSGLNIPSYEMATVIIDTPFTLTPQDEFTAIISNVNGGGADGDAIDDTTSIENSSVVPAPGKTMFAEGIVGTWCEYCPSGMVYMDYMMENYKGYFAAVAVHTADTMEIPGYDAFVSISAYPRIWSDRYYLGEPAVIEPVFLTFVQEAPAGVLLNGAMYDPATRELKVSISTKMQQDINGDYRIACVLTEDSVSGTTAAFDQANEYAGGALGEMGGYELLANPVPAAQMHYNYVARTFSPSFEGFPNAYGASAATGDVVVHNFIYTLPATWNVNQMHIVGVMLDPSGVVTNASYTSIKEAVDTGFTPGTVVGINQLADAPDAIKLAPNPASDFSNILLNLKKESAVAVEIYNSNGALVASKSYGKIVGAYNLPVDTQHLVKGMYLIRVNVNNQSSILKLIKE